MAGLTSQSLQLTTALLLAITLTHDDAIDNELHQ